jgi:hypothetical protein
MNNSWLSDLILRDLAGEDISGRAGIYEQAHLSLVDSWIPVYQDKYLLMGNTQIMVVKIFWDWAIYWSIPALLFTNKAFTNLKLLKELFASPDSPGRKFGELNKRMQDFFLAWQEHDTEIFSNRYIDPYDLEVLREFQLGIEVQHEPQALLEQIRTNMEKLEHMAAAIFRLVSTQVKGTPHDMKVDPYTIGADSTKDGLTADSGSVKAIGVDPAITRDVDLMWFYNKTAQA